MDLMFKDVFPTTASEMTSSRRSTFTFPRNFPPLFLPNPYLRRVSAFLRDLNIRWTVYMTSASELFSTRRSRPGRSDPDLESDASLYRHHHHRRHGIHHHNHRHDSDGCDSPRRFSPRLQRFCHHLGLPVSVFLWSNNLSSLISLFKNWS